MELNLDTLPRDVMRAIGFLTRLPVPAKWFAGDDGGLAVTSRAFPLAAAIAALAPFLALAVGTLLDLPVLLTAAIGAAVLVGVGGALHEDGLADCADGFFGGYTNQSRLAIMKDSRIGAFGAMALFFAILLRVIAIAAILQTGLWGGACALIASAASGRVALVWHWSDLPSARPGGTADKAGAPTEDSAVFALVTGGILALLAGIAGRGMMPALAAALLTTAVTFGFRHLCHAKIGGHTGDTLGAAAIIAELAVLVGLASGL